MTRKSILYDLYVTCVKIYLGYGHGLHMTCTLLEDDLHVTWISHKMQMTCKWLAYACTWQAHMLAIDKHITCKSLVNNLQVTGKWFSCDLLLVSIFHWHAFDFHLTSARLANDMHKTSLHDLHMHGHALHNNGLWLAYVSNTWTRLAHDNNTDAI